jgi:hypothetical protein
MTAISDKYNALGGSSGFLGAATTSELTNADGVGHHQDFANGTIYWHPALGAWEVHGAIRVRWSALGSDTSVLGYPMTDETSTPDGVGRFNHFQHGSIYWHPRTGAHDVRSRIRERWAQLRWERGFLGFPTRDHEIILRGRINVAVSQFQGGRIEWDLSNDHIQTFHTPTQSAPNYLVPVAALQARDSTTGTRAAAITAAEIQQWLARVNEVFSTTGIRFTYDGQLTVLDNSDVNNLTGDSDPQWTTARDLLNQTAAQRHALLIVFRHGPGATATGGGFSWWDYDFVVMPGFAVTTVCGVQNLGLMAHEIGHYFGLPHTHGPQFSAEQDAADFFLSRYEDATAFDNDRGIIGDTPPDPFITSLQCDPTRTSVLLAGTPFALARNDAMGYWYTSLAQTFSYDQINRIRDILANRIASGLLNVTEIDHPVRIAVVPYPVPLRRRVTLQVTAVDFESGSAVDGTVKIDGTAVAHTNTSFSYTFNPRRVPIPGTKPVQYDVVYPKGVVSFSDYPDVEIDFGFPDV